MKAGEAVMDSVSVSIKSNVLQQIPPFFFLSLWLTLYV